MSDFSASRWDLPAIKAINNLRGVPVIFVNVACYRDPECAPTIRDLFRKARYPEQINVAIILQTMPSDDIAPLHERVHIHQVTASDARGPCWARALGYRFWRGEEHVLQIDSHMRFAADWDVRLLAQLAACPSCKPLLTTYPPAYEPPDHLVDHRPAFLAAKCFDDRGILIQQALLEPRSPIPLPTAFIAAGFLFGRSDWIREVPYDPNLYFHGEETTLGVRLWSHGWDFFGPTEALIWHRYTRFVRPLHWDDNHDWEKLDAVSRARVRHLLGMTPEPGDGPVDIAGYDLGSVRTLEQYQRMSGVNFRDKTIAPHALAGGFSLIPAAAEPLRM